MKKYFLMLLIVIGVFNVYPANAASPWLTKTHPASQLIWDIASKGYRGLIPWDKANKQITKLIQSLNTDAPNTTVQYINDITWENTRLGFSFNIPYNKKWGFKKFGVAPYQETEDGILFGPPSVNCEGECTIGWSFSLSLATSEDNELINQGNFVQKKAGKNAYYSTCNLGNMFQWYDVYILGKKDNFHIKYHTPCDDKKTKKLIEKIVKSFKFYD